MSQYFPEPYELFGGDINVKVDLSNYATETDIKNISHVDTSVFALKTNLASLKTKLDTLDIDKLVANANSIDTTGIVLKPEDDTDKSEVENKNPDNNGLAKKQIMILI